MIRFDASVRAGDAARRRNRLAAAAVLACAANPSWAQTTDPRETVLPTVSVKADALDPDDARSATVSTATKTAIAAKDVPASIDSIEVSKFKTYGVNDLSVMLQGVAGVETYYDTRGEGVMIRGFEASYGDIYRDGIRESGQIRRSTANVERVEVLKGPASVLYGRGSGGGVVNLISKQASFDAVSSVGLRAGSWHNVGANLDVNRVVSPDWAVRLTADREQAHSFRSGIRNHNTLVSPSVLYDGHQGLKWLAQYTHDNVWRVPDRGPSYDNLPAGVSLRNGFAHPGDFIEDKLRMFRSVLSYEWAPDWSVRWTASHRTTEQNFDHFYLGTYCSATGTTSTGASCTWPGQVRQSYAWQDTSNVTKTHLLDVTGKAGTFGMQHDLLLGFEFTKEERAPNLFSTNATNSYIDPFNPPGAAGWSVRPVRGAPSQNNLHEVNARAFYLQDLVSFTPAWKLMAGARYDSYDFRSTNQLNGMKRDASGQAWSPRAGLVWQPLGAHSFYVSYSKSYAPYGGRGMISISTSQTAVFDAEPEYSRQYEAGVKSEWLDGSLSTQFAVYDLRRYNVRYQPDPLDPYLYAVRGADRSRGVEFSASGRLSASMYLRGSLGLQSSKVLEDRQFPASEGRHLRNTGNFNGSLFARYVPAPKWYGEIGTTFVSPQWISSTTSATTAQIPGYARWDALIGWRPLPWTLTLGITNLFDKTYWRSDSMPGVPRTFLVSGSYVF